MTRRIRIFVWLAIAMALLVPATVAQKSPAPAPPPSNPPIRPGNTSPLGSEPDQSRVDLVAFLRGRVVIHGQTAIPNDMLIERLCNNRVRQEVYAAPQGDFSMELGSRANSFAEASADPTFANSVTGRDSVMGIPQRELKNCEIRASAPGFYPVVVSLVDIDSFSGSVDVGAIVMHRTANIEGATLSAIPYKAPRDASRAYEKGMQAVRNGKLAEAHKYFETALQLYPGFATAWFQLGTVLEKQNQKDAARKAYSQATTLDTRFLSPYLSLASMACEAGNWTEVLTLTGHILDLDPLNQAAVTGYILDDGPLNYAGVYFYNAVANYKLNKMADAEKSGLKAEHLDLATRFPQLHLLLAEIFARKNNYALAIEEIQTYLALAPLAKDADRSRERLAKFEKLNGSSTTEKPDQR